MKKMLFALPILSVFLLLVGAQTMMEKTKELKLKSLKMKYKVPGIIHLIAHIAI